MRFFLLAALYSFLMMSRCFTLQPLSKQNLNSSNKRMEDSHDIRQKLRPQNITIKDSMITKPRLLQTSNLASLNNFISSLSGQLFYPVGSTGTNYNYGQNQYSSLNSAPNFTYPSGIAAPPTFNLSTPQTITGFDPETSSAPSSVTYVNASEILSVLSQNTGSISPPTSNFEGQGYDGFGRQHPDFSRNDLGSSGTMYTQNTRASGGISYLNGLNITQLLSSGLNQDQISQILATQAQIINRNSNPVNLIPQPANINSFVNQSTSTTSSNISVSNNLSNNQSNQPSSQNLGVVNYSQTTITTINRTNAPQTPSPSNASIAQIINQTVSNIQTQQSQQQNLPINASFQAQLASQQILAQQQEAQRLTLLSQQPNVTTVNTTTTTTNNTRTGQSISLSDAEIQKIIQQQQQQLQEFMGQSQRSATIQNQTSTQINQNNPNVGFFQPLSNPVTSLALTRFSNLGSNQLQQPQPIVRNMTTTTQTSTTTGTVSTPSTVAVSNSLPIQSQTQIQYCASYNLGYCVSCQSSYYLIQGLCYSASTAQGCSVFSKSQCLICMNGYYMYQNQCFKVDQRCNSFDYNNKVCIVCATGTNPKGTGCA